jgi:eukaryotic-like serine/threonine-protein kinase
MNAKTVCPRCGSERLANAPEGHCPRCLLRLGFPAELMGSIGLGARGSVSSPRSTAGDIGLKRKTGGSSASLRLSGILSTLDDAVGPVPRVLLRDGSRGEERPIRPHTDEMAHLASDAGRYHLLGEIARGGMGVVLKGRDEDLGRDLAVKVLLEKHRRNPELVRRFVEEAQIGGQLQHPGIVPVYELGQLPDERLFIAMKLLRGRTLAALLEARQEPAEDRPRFLQIFEHVCQTMAYAHSCGVIHRDLKPSNVMVGNFGEVQVMDWGLAKVLDEGGVADEARRLRNKTDALAVRTLRTGSEAGESCAGSVLGTPAYMAPEQARGALGTVDERADVFGLGSILCEILTGEPVYTDASGIELPALAERGDVAEALSRLDACGADGELVALARRCLAAAAKDRPRDAGAIVTALSAYQASVQERLKVAEVAQARAEARAIEERKRRVLAIGLALAVLLIAALVGGGWSWVARDRAARAEETNRVVNEALHAAALKLGEARSDPGDPTVWVEAYEAASRARALLPRRQCTADLCDRVDSLLATVSRERTDADLKRRDRRMLERLAEIHNDLGVHLDGERADAEYATAFRHYGVDIDALDPVKSGRLLGESPVAIELANALDQWTFIRRSAATRDLPGAQRLSAVAREADADPWRTRLRETLDVMVTDRSRALEGLLRLAATADADQLPEASVTRLAFALSSLGSRETAIALLRRSQRVHPDDFWLNMDLGRELSTSGEHEEAGRFFLAAVAIRPRSSLAHGSLAMALEKSGRLKEAADTLRRDIRLWPEESHQHVRLGAVLLSLGDSSSAEGEFFEAKRLRPDDWFVRNEIASAFVNRGRYELGLGELREAARCEPMKAYPHEALGRTLLDLGRLDEAVAALNTAVERDPGFAQAHISLGRALMARGEFQAALSSFRLSQRGSPAPPYHRTATEMVREAERMIALDARLPALVRREERMTTASERIRLARLCQIKHLFASSAAIWDELFAAEPRLAAEQSAGHRYSAACAAVRAACGESKEDTPPDRDTRDRLRRKAREWLEADLAAVVDSMTKGSPRERSTGPSRLGRWLAANQLAGVRDQTSLQALSETERRDWTSFWTKVEETIDKGTQKAAARTQSHERDSS